MVTVRHVHWRWYRYLKQVKQTRTRGSNSTGTVQFCIEFLKYFMLNIAALLTIISPNSFFHEYTWELHIIALYCFDKKKWRVLSSCYWDALSSNWNINSKLLVADHFHGICNSFASYHSLDKPIIRKFWWPQSKFLHLERKIKLPTQSVSIWESFS